MDSLPRWVTGTQADRLGLLPAAQEHILAQENGKDRCVRSVRIWLRLSCWGLQRCIAISQCSKGNY